MSTHLTVYTTPPQQERKARDEIVNAGFNAVVPMEERDTDFGPREYPTAPGYVFATGKPFNAHYVRRRVGVTTEDGMKVLILTGRIRERMPRDENPYKKGDHVIIAKGAFTDIRAEVLETRGRTCLIAHEMMHKVHTQAISYTQLRPG